MTDQLQKALADFLQILLSGLQTGATFAGKEIPLIIREKLHYEIYSSLVWIGIGLVVILLAWILQQVLFRLAKRMRGDRTYASDGEEFLICAPPIIASILTIVFLIDIIYNIDHVIWVWIAPRVYILEWIRTLIKG